MLACGKCGVMKPAESFSPDKRIRCGRRSVCKECTNNAAKARRASNSYDPRHHRRIVRQSKYGLPWADIELLYRNSGGCCHVCGKACVLEGQNRAKIIQIDHNRKTGRVRGLLCKSCNTALGLAKDSPALLRTMARYLERIAEDERDSKPPPPAD